MELLNKSAKAGLPNREQAACLTAQMTTGGKGLPDLVQCTGHTAAGHPRYNWWNEALHGIARAGTATVFPQAIAMAAAFDEEMMEKVGEAVSTERAPSIMPNARRVT